MEVTKILNRFVLKSKLVYCPKQPAKVSNASPNKTQYDDINVVSTSSHSKDSSKSSSKKGNGKLDNINFLSLKNSFEALNNDNTVLESVVTPTDGKENDNGTNKGGADLGSTCMPNTSYVASMWIRLVKVQLP